MAIEENLPRLPNGKPISFATAFLPIAFFFFSLLYGLLLHPKLFGDKAIPDFQESLPVEILILLAMTVTGLYLFLLGFKWKTIEKSMVKKVGESIPVVLILLAIGVLIGSWIVSGTIPMLIYHGISLVQPNWIYLFSFLICIVFSMLTGTSWGSAGTIGVVMIGIAGVFGASLPITAGAIVGGSFFGDKMSPLSDTTNVAALATKVDVMDHIRSMLYTTGPSAIIAAIIYFFLSPKFTGASFGGDANLASVQLTLTELKQLFNFNWLLLLPLLVVVWGSIKRYPIFLTLMGSAWLAMLLAFILQDFTVSDVFHTFKDGFSTAMAEGGTDLQSNAINILNRGGLYNLIEGAVICILIFAFIGMLDVIQAIQISIRSLMQKLKKRYQAVAGALAATLVTNLTASNQYATSFIIGETFGKKFDDLKIKRKVLSRSIEDAGTMMENLAPWTPSGIFMALALGVAPAAYAQYQFLSWINILVAFIFAFTGIACFYGKKK